jgi:hypothetical protein
VSKETTPSEFLDRLKPLLEAGSLSFDPRNVQKTWKFMLAEGLSEEDAYYYISKLKPEDYQWGPEPDDNGSPGEVMLFHYPFSSLFPPYDRIRLYIKLKIWVVQETGQDAGIVMSFHNEGNYE